MNDEVNINFPALAFHKDQGGLLSLDYKYLIGSKKGVSSSFKGVTLVDSNGIEFEFEGVKAISGVKILDSIKYGLLMVRLKPILKNKPCRIKFDSFKIKVIETFEENLDFWNYYYDAKTIRQEITQAQTFKELILIFK